MFVRVKKIKDKEYAYLVENVWTDKGSRQKTKAYLGVVKQVDKNPSQAVVQWVAQGDRWGVVSQMLCDELVAIGFIKASNSAILENDQGVVVDLVRRKVYLDKKQVVVRLRGGFICSYTLDALKSAVVHNHKQYAHRLAKALLAVGLELDSSMYIDLYEYLLSV